MGQKMRLRETHLAGGNLLLLLSLLNLVWLAGCELTETVVPPGETVVVMQSIVSRTRSEQWVLLEYSLAGSVSRGPTGGPVPPESPRLPIAGALVTVEHLGPGPCAARVDTLVEGPVVTSGAVASGVYRWRVQCAYDAGDRLRVRAETPAGEVVTGATRLPGIGRYDITVGTTAAQFPLDQLIMNRIADTMRIGVVPTFARAMQVEVRRAEDQNDIAIYLFTDTLGITLPGNMVNPFEGEDGGTVFRAGRFYLLSVAVIDSNYYDFIRSRSDPLTGRGFLNHVDGGIGLVGSVEAQSWLLAVVAPQTDPREGRYRITGTARDVSVDLTLDVYLDELGSTPQWDVFSAFVNGMSFLGTVRRSGDGFFVVDGGPEDGGLVFGFDIPTADGLRHFELVGYPSSDGTAFPVQFGDTERMDTLRMQRIP